jgi:4'-phosphopantetheinyl transferase
VTSHSDLTFPATSELHVWRAWLPTDAGVLARCETMLAPDEKDRARRFLVQKARCEFVGTRGMLRRLLAAYCGGSPSEIWLKYGPKGKPEISAENGTGPRGTGPLRFNVSHSHGLAVVAFARDADVGIDVEKIREDFGGDEIASSQLPQEARARGFFRCWTRKEAYLKARGDGLQIPLRDFHVSIMTEQAQGLIDETGSRWTVYGFEPASGFAGAVSVRAEGLKLTFREWRHWQAEEFETESRAKFERAR